MSLIYRAYVYTVIKLILKKTNTVIVVHQKFFWNERLNEKNNTFTVLKLLISTQERMT
jgi:hypothetical protein